MLKPSNLSTRLVVFATVIIATGSCKPRLGGSLASREVAEDSSEKSSPFELFSPAAWTEYGVDIFNNQSLKGRFDLFSLSYSDLAQLTGNFQISINEQKRGLILRQERWRLATDVGPGSKIAAQPILMRLSAGREISYSRAFTSVTEASKAVVITPMQIPFNADKALAMNPGDFVSIPTNMGIALGLEEGVSAGRSLALNTGSGVFWVGEFRINIYRQDQKFVRVKIAPSSKKGFEMHANISARLNMFGYSKGRIINYDRQAENILGLDFLRWSRERVFEGEKFAFDYQFNLEDPQAKAAYNAVLTSTLKLKKAFRPRELSDDLVFADFTYAEHLNSLDSKITEPTQKRVVRLFQGSNNYTSDTTAGRLGFRPLKVQRARSLSNNELTVDDGGPGRFISAQVYTSSHQSKSWISALRENASLTASVLYDSTPNFSEHVLRDVKFSWNFGQSDLKPKEISDIGVLYWTILGQADYAKLGLASNVFLQDDLKRFSSTLEVVLSNNLTIFLDWKLQLRPEEAQKIVDQALENSFSRYSKSRSGFTSLRENLQAAFKGNFTDMEKSFRQAMRKATLGMKSPHDGQFMKSMFQILNAQHPAGEVVVAGYLIELAKGLGIEPYLSVRESAKGVEKRAKELGQDSNESFRERVNRALYALNHLGYES